MIKNSQKILLATIAITSVIAFSAGWFGAKNIANTQNSTLAQSNNPDPVIQSGPIADSIKSHGLNEVWTELQNAYYDSSKLDKGKLSYGAIKGLVAAIDDPYTVFMTPEESKTFNDDLEGQLEGIGAELEVKDGKLVVVSPLKGSPAEKAGIKPGDIIYKIDGAVAEEMTLYAAVKKIRGKPGTSVTLTVIHEKTSAPAEIKITRSEITVDSVTVEKLDGDIFHVSINQFNDHTKKEFLAAVQRILLEKAKGIILDLRGNGGGYLDTSVDVLSELVSGKQTAVIIKHRDQTQNETVKTSGSGRIADLPLVVLVDKGSASASEIVAGAVQDLKRGVLIGVTTFGKGSVQELNRLSDGSNLRMTIAKWFTPNDRTIDEVGITPDKIVEITDDDIKAKKDTQLDAAKEYFKSKAYKNLK